MADEFRATTTIRYGKKIEDKNDPTKPARVEEQVFEPGDVVTGLSKDEMKQLWDAGALERREGKSDSEPAAVSDAGGDSESGASKSGGQTSGGDSGATPSSPTK